MPKPARTAAVNYDENAKAAYASCIGSLAVLKSKYPKYIVVEKEKLPVTYYGKLCRCKEFTAYAEASDSGVSVLSDAFVRNMLFDNDKLMAKLLSAAAVISKDFDGINIYLQKEELQ